jgi:hypothetical protein
MTEYRQIMVSLPIEDLEYLRAQPSQEQLAALKDAAERARDQWAEEVARLEARFESFRVALVHALDMDEDATAEQIVAAVSWTAPAPALAELVSGPPTAWTQSDGPPTQSMTPIDQPASEYWCETCKDKYPPNDHDHYHCVNCLQRTGMLGHPDGCPATAEQPTEAVSTDGE